MTYVFTWDARKAAKNLERHKISFEEARTVFFDPFLLTFPDDEHSNQENREISIGYSERSRLLLVVHTERGETEKDIFIRIISCRKATPRERQVYDEART